MTKNICRVGHSLYGVCELIYGHEGPHSRVPGGSDTPNTWAWGDCACDPCRAYRADEMQRQLDARNGEIRCLKARIAALEAGREMPTLSELGRVYGTVEFEPSATLSEALDIAYPVTPSLPGTYGHEYVPNSRGGCRLCRRDGNDGE